MEAKSTFFIPKQIKVGYRERYGTYTGKLAYVVYYDQKGILRKETSWQSWRDKKLGEDTFNNEPISGFVLNKHAGGYSSGWNHRQSYCRVYDPRGFEIEITIDNLLWILDWSDCYKGKGLDGKFCYGWNGTDLVLIPECTEDYKESKTFSDSLFITPTIEKKNLVIGSSYKLKMDDDMIYIGEFKIQNKLGTRYYSKSLFMKYNKPNILYPVNSSSVLMKKADNVLSAEEIKEINYRFSLTAYSLDFWNNGLEFIEEFIPISKECKICRYEATGDLTWEAYDNKRAIVSGDGKSVKLYKGLEVDNRTGSYGSWVHYYTLYPFIELGKSGNIISKFNDAGKHERKDGSRYYGEITYPDVDISVINDIKRNKTKNENECITNGTTLIYKTVDGYYSSSLYDLLKDNNLSYTSDVKNIDKFKLPVKDIKEL